MLDLFRADNSLDSWLYPQMQNIGNTGQTFSFTGSNYSGKGMIDSLHVSKVKAFTIQLVTGVLPTCVLDENELLKAKVFREG